MSRVVKRVPLDFNYPEQTWVGYINPYKSVKCEYCNGSGYNKETYEILKNTSSDMMITQDDVDALIDNNRLWEFVRVPLNEEQKKDCLSSGWLPYNNGYKVTATEINNIVKEHNPHNMFFGHDTCNQLIIAKSRAKRLGVYGECPYCHGTGEFYCSEEIKQLHYNFEYIEPPIGEGYQLWSTTIDGPCTPVFKSIEELARYCTDNETIFANQKMSYDEWYKFISDNSDNISTR